MELMNGFDWLIILTLILSPTMLITGALGCYNFTAYQSNLRKLLDFLEKNHQAKWKELDPDSSIFFLMSISPKIIKFLNKDQSIQDLQVIKLRDDCSTKMKRASLFNKIFFFAILILYFIYFPYRT